MVKQDLEAMFNGALSASEDDDDVAKGGHEIKKAKKVVVETAPVEETFHEDVSDNEVEVKDNTYISKNKANDKAKVEEKQPEPQPEPEPIYTYQEPVVADGTPEFIAQIVALSDLYRNFDDKTAELAGKLFETEDEAEALATALVQQVITLDALKSLESVHKATDVDKAFFLVALPDELLQEIGRLVKVFTDKEVKFTDHIQYCRNLEIELRKMNDDFIAETNAILELLTAAQPQK